MRGALLLVVLACPALLGQAPPDAGPPAPDIPAYTDPVDLLDELAMPPGTAAPGADGRVCYDAPALARLVLTTKSARGLSDDRARRAWHLGWQAGAEKWAARVGAEHALRLDAEAARDGAEARAAIYRQAAEAREPAWWQRPLEVVLGAALFALGVGVGLVGG